MYSPEEFGIFTAFLSYSGTLGAFIFLSVELAIVKSNSVRELSSVFGLMFLISLSFLSIFIVTVYFESFFYAFIGFDKLFDIKELVVFGVIFAAVNLVLNQFITRKEQFSVYATSQVSFVFLRFLFSYLFFYFGCKKYGLVFGFIVASILIVCFLIYTSKIYKEKLTFKKVNIFAVYRKHRHLVFFNTPASVINTLLISFPVFYIFKFYGAEAAGFFGLAFRMVQLPITIVNKAMGQVMYKKFIDLENKPHQVQNFVYKNMFVLSCSLPFFIILYIYGSSIFSLVFGPSWNRSGEMASLMSPYIFFSFIASPITYYFVAYNKTKHFLLISLLSLLCLIIMSLSMEINSIDEFIFYYSVLNIGFCIFVMLYIIGDLRLSLNKSLDVVSKN